MSTWQQAFAAFGALFGLLGVAAGAFGAHLLKSRISGEMLQIYETAVRYQLIHALALMILVALLFSLKTIWLTFAGTFFIVGVILFSGSLYLLALTVSRSWGVVTPIGGTLLLLGWLCLLLGSLFAR